MPLQRAMTDFGADHAFGQVPKKLHVHYGIEMPVSTIRKITEFHGEHMHQQRETMTLSLTTPGCQQQIGEIDGCMLPIVTIGEKEGDKQGDSPRVRPCAPDRLPHDRPPPRSSR